MMESYNHFCLFESFRGTRKPSLSRARLFLALCQMMLVKRNLRIIWTEQKEERLFVKKDSRVVQNQIWVRMNLILARIFC
ncbi:hypothetical protein EAX59_00035, partial [Enterococcus faecium]